jgi:hypothetical protein
VQAMHKALYRAATGWRRLATVSRRLGVVHWWLPAAAASRGILLVGDKVKSGKSAIGAQVLGWVKPPSPTSLLS